MKEMPLQSLLRFLGKMTSNKILEPGSAEIQAVCDRIQCETALKKVGAKFWLLHVLQLHVNFCQYLKYVTVLKPPGKDQPLQPTFIL